QELVVKVEQDAKDNTVKLSDNDLTTLYTLINKIADRPVLAQAFFDKSDAAKALATPIKQEMDKNTTIKSLINGVKE
ncbi:MAG: hypothetical protein ACRDBM_03055, partial [Sporomusa sp.]